MDAKLKSMLQRLGDAVQEIHIADACNNEPGKRIASDRFVKGAEALSVSLICITIKLHRLRHTPKALERIDTGELRIESGDLIGKKAILDVYVIYDRSSPNKSQWRWQKGEVKISFADKSEDSLDARDAEVTRSSLMSQEESDKFLRECFGDTPPYISDLP